MRTTLHNLLTVVFLFAALMLTVLLVLLLAGFKPYVLVSSSMEPTISSGSIVFTKHVPLEEIVEGDIVVYRTNGSLVLHRYLGDNQIAGDANNISQSIHLTASNFVGKYSFSVPGIGVAISFLLSHHWILVVLIIAVVILACYHPTPRGEAI